MQVIPDVDFCEFIVEEVVKFVSLLWNLIRGILEFDTSFDDIIQTMKWVFLLFMVLLFLF